MHNQIEQPFNGFDADAGQQEQNPLPCQFVCGIGNDSQIGDHITDIGHLVKLPTTEELEPYAPFDEFRLEGHGRKRQS